MMNQDTNKLGDSTLGDWWRSWVDDNKLTDGGGARRLFRGLSHAGTVVPECFKNNESQWKSVENWKIWPHCPENPWTDGQKIWRGWWCRGHLPLCKISLRSDKEFLLPRHSAAQSDSVSFFGFWRRHTEKPPAPIFTIYTSDDVVSRKDVPYGAQKTNFTFRPHFPPKRKFLANFDRTKFRVKKALAVGDAHLINYP